MMRFNLIPGAYKMQEVATREPEESPRDKFFREARARFQSNPKPRTASPLKFNLVPESHR
jgi:hypothetical protein